MLGGTRARLRGCERGAGGECLGESGSGDGLSSRGEPFDLEGLAIAIIAITGARRIC